MQEHSYISRNDKKVFYHKWETQSVSKGVIQIIHGMAEHSKRYDDFARFLNNEGFIVYADDHVGHGLTCKNSGKYGFLYSENGWMKMVDDVKFLNEMIHSEYPTLPVYILGHSMGSFIARSLMIKYPSISDKWIISGTGYFSQAELIGGQILTKLSLIFKHQEKQATFIDKISFGANNKRFKSEGEFAWLSRDRMIVDKYIADPYCGGVFTLGFFRDLFSGIRFIQQSQNIDTIPKETSILLISGNDDPVGNFGKSIQKLKNIWEDKNINVDMKLFKDMRHEILNEIGKKTVYQTILEYIK